MFSKAGVTEVYCMADDFCKEIAWQQGKYMVREKRFVLMYHTCRKVISDS